ncbi:MAG: DUF3737 family protein [Oscillospiraceae bacterium]|nr:DUF3737 family protein [Oscillospiraceae bacterium]
MTELRQQKFVGERALFHGRDLRIVDSVFEDGESPLKESRNIELTGCMFRWKYPLWYAEDITAEDCTWYDTARAGVWYSNRVAVKDAIIEAPKNFRRCAGLRLENVQLTNAAETLWNCRDVQMKNVLAKGDYFAMNCADMEIEGLRLDGNYGFDGAKNVVIRGSKLLTKDAFWNTENVTVYDSFISGEYLGWNAKNLTLVDCTIESLQGMCYIENLIMKNCKLLDTTYAFEYSTMDAEIVNRVDSVLNPGGGTLRAAGIGKLILEKERVDPGKTEIFCEAVEERPERPEW